MKNRAERGKMAIKKWGFRGKKWVIGSEKIVSWRSTRKAKWCKMQVICLKMDKSQGEKEHKK